MSDPGERRRRIDRVTSPDYLEGLDERTLPEIRAMRDDCREEESRLSYARRVVQGQADIARAEQARRQGDDGEGLVGALTKILADQPSPGSRDVGRARSSPMYTAEDGLYGARAHDSHVDDGEVSRVPELDDDELQALLDRLVEQEHMISGLRRSVLDNLDALSEELIRRYQKGGLDVDDVVASAVRTEPPVDER